MAFERTDILADDAKGNKVGDKMIPLIVMLLCGVCMAIGGWHILQVRRMGIPLLLCGYTLFVTHNLWCLTMLATWGVLSIGYGDNAPLRHIFGQTWGRGVWGILVALCLSLAMFLTGHIALPWFVLYLLIVFFFEPLFKNLPQIIGDIIIGCGFGVIVFMVH